MDFIVGLPTEKSGYKNVLVVVNRFTKMTHFITITRMDTERTATVLVEDIWRFHGLPESRVSDRGSQLLIYLFIDHIVCNRTN